MAGAGGGGHPAGAAGALRRGETVGPFIGSGRGIQPVDVSDFKDADRRHHKGTFVSHQGQKGLSLPAIGEHIDLTRGIHHNALEAHKRSASR